MSVSDHSSSLTVVGSGALVTGNRKKLVEVVVVGLGFDIERLIHVAVNFNILQRRNLRLCTINSGQFGWLLLQI